MTSISASRHYVVIVYGHKSVYYQSTESSFQSRDWLPIETPASQIAVSISGQQLWRLYKGTAYQGLIVNPHCPVAQHWTVLDSYISSIGIVQLVIFLILSLLDFCGSERPLSALVGYNRRHG